MTERRRRVVDDQDEELEELSKRDRYRAQLAIDKDQLDECLVQQPELYYHVAEELSHAVARRDALKIDADIAEAEEARRLRDLAEREERKMTEGALKEELTLSPRLQRLRRERVEAEAEISSWVVLKESFQQRSYMLRELVPMHLSRFNSGSMNLGPREQLHESNRARIKEARERRYSDRS